MKSKFTLLVVVVLMAAVLWHSSGRVANNAASNERFMALYSAAKAAYSSRPIYAAAPPAETTEAPRTDAAPDAEEGAQENAESAEAAGGPTGRADLVERKGRSLAAETGYRQAPHLALMLAPLALFESPAAAGLALYWTNVALVVIAIILGTYVLHGRVFTGGKATAIISAFAIIPFLMYLLGGASVAMLALVLVLVSLALFRLKFDILAGVVSALAVFSPLGVGFGAYWFLKRSWKAAIAFVLVTFLLLVAGPLVTLGISDGFREVKGYWSQAVMPYFALTAETEPLQFAENQSLWAVFMRHTTEISDLGRTASGGVERVFKINIAELTSDYMAVMLFTAGAVFLIVSVVVLCRKLPERASVVIALEGSLVILAVLVLSMRTTLATMSIVVFPLMVAMYVIRNTQMRRAVHHANYVALVLAVAFFYLSLDPRFKMLGTSLAGVVALWIAMLAALRHFRPKMVSGRVWAAFEQGRSDVLSRPVDLVSIRSDAEREPARGEGVLPMPEFTRRHAEGRPYALGDEREIPDFERIKLEGEAEEQRLQGEEEYRKKQEAEADRAQERDESAGADEDDEPEETDSAF